MKSFIASIALVAAAPASAAALPVVNAGFDARALDDGGFTFGNTPGGSYGGGWSGLPGANNNGLYNPTADVFAAIPSEANVAYVGTGVDAGGAYNGGFFQTLAQSVQAGTRYDLSVEVGRRADDYALADFVVELLAGGQVLASGTFLPGDIAAGQFRTLSFGYAATGGEAGSLGLRVRSIYDPAQGMDYRQTLFDDVRLDATAAAVPEPATWATMMLGFALVGGAVRRRRLIRPAC